MIEETRKPAGLDFEELEAQGAELLPDRVEMKKVQKAAIFQSNVAAFNFVGGDLNQVNEALIVQVQ